MVCYVVPLTIDCRLIIGACKLTLFCRSLKVNQSLLYITIKIIALTFTILPEERDITDNSASHMGTTHILYRNNRSNLSYTDTSRAQMKHRKKWDVFICHASEDKEEIADPLANKLTRLGIKVWYDKFRLRWGNRLMKQIDRGLVNSKYGIVILSCSFFDKHGLRANWKHYFR